jgi:hypothetical protein
LRADGHAEHEQDEEDAEEDGGGLEAAAEEAPALAGWVVEDEGAWGCRARRVFGALYLL